MSVKPGQSTVGQHLLQPDPGLEVVAAMVQAFCTRGWPTNASLKQL